MFADSLLCRQDGVTELRERLLYFKQASGYALQRSANSRKWDKYPQPKGLEGNSHSPVPRFVQRNSIWLNSKSRKDLRVGKTTELLLIGHWLDFYREPHGELQTVLHFFDQIQELRCLQATQSKPRHLDSLLKLVWWLVPQHVPNHTHCVSFASHTPGDRPPWVQQHHCHDTASGTAPTKGTVISREMAIGAAGK